ncbi:MAG: ankyrin repeat domain-containing protein [Candidatus Hydrogenedentes bacterium]|nr:ankyrin repeat domain-containing protein [Candidatus Hydrogenedentota bacterium]
MMSTVYWRCLEKEFTRVTIFSTFLYGNAGGFFRWFWTETGINLGVWALLSVAIRMWSRLEEVSYRPTSLRALFASIIVAFVLTGIPTLYFSKYKTLEDAVWHGDIALAEKRLEFNLLGVDANTGYITSVSGYDTITTDPLLPVAVRQGDLAMAKLLIAHGADLNRGGLLVYGPLTEAVFKRSFDMVTFLLEQGADPSSGVGAAASLNTSEFLELFLARGGRPSCGLSWAIYDNRAENLQLLLDHGATPLGVDSAGRTLLDVAGTKDTDDCFRILSQYTRDIRHPNEFIEHGKMGVLELAFGLGLDVNAEYPGQNGKLETMLACATRLGKQEFIDMLVKAGAKSDTGEASTRGDASEGTLR